jgi:hypothetical protein
VRQPVGRELADRLEHDESRGSENAVAAAEHALGHEAFEYGGRSVGHRLAHGRCRTADEHRETIESRALRVGEEPVAPPERRAERPMTIGRITKVVRQVERPGRHAFSDLGW